MHNRTGDENDVAVDSIAADNAEALQDTLAELTASGVDRIDPVRFRYIQSLAARCDQSDSRVTQFLLQKARAALESYQAVVDAQHAHSTLQYEYNEKQETRSALAVLIEQLDTSNCGIDSAQKADTHANHESSQTAQDANSPLFQATQSKNNTPRSGGLRELKAAQFFRDTLQQQRADTLLSRAILDAPEDSGPLNPQKLALRSLSIMRELSPAYLGHFVSYVDTLLWLEKIDHSQPDFKASKRQTKASWKS